MHKFRYEVASERKTIRGFTSIPEADISAKKEHISDNEKFKKILRFALDGDVDSVKGMLSEFPVYKREDLKEMLIRSAAGCGKSLEFWKIKIF